MKKMLEKTLIEEKNNYLSFGKCFFNQIENHKEFLDKYIHPHYENHNIHYEHADICPLIHAYENKNLEERKILDFHFQNLIKTKNKKISYASVGVIFDKNNNVLITRRSKSLFTFPSAWVFPGGKLDKEENFEDALLREVSEETGININKNLNGFSYIPDIDKKPCDTVISPFLLYESVYPDFIWKGLPIAQCLALFFSIKIDMDKEDINILIQKEEIDSYAWINFDELTSALLDERKIYFEAFEYVDEGNLERKQLSEENLVNWSKKGEGFTYGHFIAVKKLNLETERKKKEICLV